MTLTLLGTTGRAALLALLVAPFTALAATSVFLDELTTSEVSAGLKAGKTTIIIPVGGTEQSGPHLALGKHNARVRVLAGRIAGALGDALVAPAVAYVPEGNVSPPTEHMRFAGTVSIPEAVFKGLLAGAAQSFRQHGFKNIVLIGDHGGYQSQLQAVATSLNKGWAGTPAQAHFIAAYYTASQTTFSDALKARGMSSAQIGVHGGVADTSLLMATAPDLVRPDEFANAFRVGRAGGVNGDPRASSAALGQAGADEIVSQTIAAIRLAVKTPR